MPPYIEYCALHYLDQWFSKERRIRAGLRSNDDEVMLRSLADAMSFFQVARNFPKKYDVCLGRRRYAPLLKVVKSVSGEPRPKRNDFTRVVEHFRRSISQAYGGRDVLSASTKLLWLLYRDPIIIYDSRVRSVLKSSTGDYSEYVAKWDEGFRSHSRVIARACGTLDGHRRLLSCGHLISDTQLRAVCKKKWFHRRVYDIYLWHVAGSGG